MPDNSVDGARSPTVTARDTEPVGTVLFLCTGNYYRSRFAESWFNFVAAGIGTPWRAESRGLATERGVGNVGPISPTALQRLADLGVPASGLRTPLSVSEDDLRRSQLVIALKEAEHRPLLLERHPGWADRVEYWHIHDVDVSPPEEALAVLERMVVALATRLSRAMPGVL